MSGLLIDAELENRLCEWLFSGDVGVSSQTIVSVMVGSRMLAPRYGRDTPADPSDLNRCVKLLDRFPEWRLRLGEMASVNMRWARVAAAFDVLERSLREESARGPNAPLTWVGLEAANHGVESGIRLAARMGFDILAATEMAKAVESAVAGVVRR